MSDHVDRSRLLVGSALSEFVDRLEERVAMVISGDLSHTYHTDCVDPLYLPDKS